MPTLQEAALNLINMDRRMADLAWRAQVVASAMGLPDQFVQGIGWRRVGDGHWQLYNSWMGANYHTGERDVPLALFFEGGTQDHVIVPVYAKALAWRVTYAGKAFPGEGRAGMAFSAGHVVSGLPPTHAMRTELGNMRSELADYIATALQPALQKMVEAGAIG